LLQSPVEGLVFLRFAQHSSGAAESRDVLWKRVSRRGSAPAGCEAV